MKTKLVDIKSKTLDRRSAGKLFLLAAIFCFVFSGSLLTGQEADSVDQVRDTLDSWVETRRIISKEKNDWAMGKEVLLNRIDLVQREIESLRTRINEAEDSIADADKKRTDLVEENEKLKVASTALSGTVVVLEDRTKHLLKQLPDPIRERVKPLSQRFPDDPEDTKLSLSERFMNIVGILNAVNKFNGEITVTSEVRDLSDGTTAEVTALYVGIGQGYYVSADAKYAGVGSSSAEGWVWSPANESAAEITLAIQILKNEKAAEFVQLPIRIQ